MSYSNHKLMFEMANAFSIKGFRQLLLQKT